MEQEDRLFHKEVYEPEAKVNPPPLPGGGEGSALTAPQYLSRISENNRSKHPGIIRQGEVQSKLRKIKQQLRLTREQDCRQL